MTTDNPKPTPSAVPVGSYVEWGPIIAGSVLASGLSLVLLSFGSAVGLAIVSPWSTAAVATSVILGGAFWFLMVQLLGFCTSGLDWQANEYSFPEWRSQSTRAANSNL